MSTEIITNSAIYFWNNGKEFKYGCFCNFHWAPFRDSNNIVFPTSEHYFMYQKCKFFEPTNTQALETILKTRDPNVVKSMGRKVANYDEGRWNAVKYGYMYRALEYKFGQHPDLKQILLETGNKVIYEASETDRIWGIGFNAIDAYKTSPAYYGQNLLGIALMELRASY